MQEVMENEDLLVHVLRMAGHAPLRRAFLRRRALADGEGRRDTVEDVTTSSSKRWKMRTWTP